MLAGVPNMAYAFGYVNQSWTLGADVSSQRVCRLLNYMDEHGYESCTPRSPAGLGGFKPFFELSSGYVRRGGDLFPRQGSDPWYRPQSYPRDRRSVALDPGNDPALEFVRAKGAARTADRLAA
jgi:hypothetical protein